MTARWLVPIVLVFSLAACTRPPQRAHTGGWRFADLRAMDAPDASAPALDLIAAYVRENGADIQVRLDMLEMNETPEVDLYLALDVTPGKMHNQPQPGCGAVECDAVLVFPARGEIRILSEQETVGKLSARVLRDPVNDTLEINIKRRRASWSPLARFQVSTASPQDAQVADASEPIPVKGLPPARAAVLLAFWDTFPAYTPAQALRRWDGAHTGPLGGRHGLSRLLQTAASAGVPMALLDLKTPQNISALEYLDVLDAIRQAEEAGLLILPEVLPLSPFPIPPQTASETKWISVQPDWLVEKMLADNRDTAAGFGFAPRPFLYSPSGELPNTGYRLVFTPGMGSQTRPQRWEGLIRIPIPVATENAADNGMTIDGPSETMRRELVNSALRAAMSKQEPELLVLGGSLPESAWGEPLRARAAFRYIANHPWIQPLDANQLLALQTAPSDRAQRSTLQEVDAGAEALLQTLNYLADEPPAIAAWQAYQALFLPVPAASAELLALRANYLTQIDGLLEAARWSETAQESAGCERDVDLDGEVECILASQDVFALIDPGDGALKLLFTRANGSVHQVVGPSYQLVSGAGNPADWKLDQGTAADPDVIQGAFAGGGPFLAQVSDGQIVLISMDGAQQRTIGLINGGIRIDFQQTTPVQAPTLQIPLLLDPWERFTPGWAGRYTGEENASSLSWSLASQIKVEVSSSAPISMQTFLDSRQQLTFPENPDREFAAGHYLPFPAALVSLSTLPSQFYVTIHSIAE